MKSCYKISQANNVFYSNGKGGGASSTLILSFAEDVTNRPFSWYDDFTLEDEDSDPVRANLKMLDNAVWFYFSSDQNAYGIESRRQFGSPSSVKQLLGVDFSIIVKPTKFAYLKERSWCVEQSFWQLVETTFVPAIPKHCPNSCSPLGMPNKSLPICETKTDWECSNEAFNEAINKVENEYTSPCTNLEYALDTKTYYLKELPPILSNASNVQRSIKLTYTFQVPETMLYHHEYYVYRFSDFVGSVGGTFGMCIGFSFHGSLTSIVSRIKDLIMRQ